MQFIQPRESSWLTSYIEPCQTEELIPVGSFNIMSDAGFLCGFRHVHRKKSFQFADRSGKSFLDMIYVIFINSEFWQTTSISKPPLLDS